MANANARQTGLSKASKILLAVQCIYYHQNRRISQYVPTHSNALNISKLLRFSLERMGLGVQHPVVQTDRIWR